MPHTKEFYEQRPQQDPYSGHFRLQSERDAARGWQAHIDAGRLGKGPQTTDQQKIIHARNELILCGRKY